MTNMLKKLVLKSNEKVNLNDLKIEFKELTKKELQEKVIGGEAYGVARTTHRKGGFFF